MDEDTQDAAEFQQQLLERRQRENELFARAPSKQEQLREMMRELDAMREWMDHA